MMVETEVHRGLVVQTTKYVRIYLSDDNTDYFEVQLDRLGQKQVRFKHAHLGLRVLPHVSNVIDIEVERWL